MEARDKKILIQSVSAVLIIVVLFNVYSGITVSKIGIPGLIDIEFDDRQAGEQQNPDHLVSTTTNEREQENNGPPLVDDDFVLENPNDFNQPDEPEEIYRPVQQAVADLNGVWYGNDGSEYEISQTGGSVFFTEYGMFGETARGSGSYLKNRLVLEYETVIGTFGTATLNLSQNGQVLSGRADDMTSGASTQLYLTKE